MSDKPLPFLFEGQPYFPLDPVPYTRTDGQSSTLYRWRSRCTTCGDTFEITTATPILPKGRSPNRRCKVHARPGQRVRSVSVVIPDTLTTADTY